MHYQITLELIFIHAHSYYLVLLISFREMTDLEMNYITLTNKQVNIESERHKPIQKNNNINITQLLHMSSRATPGVLLGGKTCE